MCASYWHEVLFTIHGTFTVCCFPSLADGLEPVHSHKLTQSPFDGPKHTSVRHLAIAGGMLS